MLKTRFQFYVHNSKLKDSTKDTHQASSFLDSFYRLHIQQSCLSPDSLTCELDKITYRRNLLVGFGPRSSILDVIFSLGSFQPILHLHRCLIPHGFPNQSPFQDTNPYSVLSPI
eukprot:jgi/Psemu1/45666/gm1.45666_g